MHKIRHKLYDTTGPKEKAKTESEISSAEHWIPYNNQQRKNQTSTIWWKGKEIDAIKLFCCCVVVSSGYMRSYGCVCVCSAFVHNQMFKSLAPCVCVGMFIFLKIVRACVCMSVCVLVFAFDKKWKRMKKGRARERSRVHRHRKRDRRNEKRAYTQKHQAQNIIMNKEPHGTYRAEWYVRMHVYNIRDWMKPESNCENSPKLK